MLGSKEFIRKCQTIVASYANEHVYKSDNVNTLIEDDVYVVWYSKSLQNHKALLSTPLPDCMYYELTYNGDKEEIYFDAYKKFDNKRISINED